MSYDCQLWPHLWSSIELNIWSVNLTGVHELQWQRPENLKEKEHAHARPRCCIRKWLCCVRKLIMTRSSRTEGLRYLPCKIYLCPLGEFCEHSSKNNVRLAGPVLKVRIWKDTFDRVHHLFKILQTSTVYLQFHLNSCSFQLTQIFMQLSHGLVAMFTVLPDLSVNSKSTVSQYGPFHQKLFCYGHKYIYVCIFSLDSEYTYMCVFSVLTLNSKIFFNSYSSSRHGGRFKGGA